MPEIILTETQAKIVAQSEGRLEIRDGRGSLMGYFEPPLAHEMVGELERGAASQGPCYTGQQLQARLRALEKEWDRTGGFEEPYMATFLKRLDDEDPGHMRPRG